MSVSEFGGRCDCGGCESCLQDQGYTIEGDTVVCERCLDEIDYEERFESLGYTLCERCTLETAKLEPMVPLEA